MFERLNPTTTLVFVALFGLVSLLGFLAARWRQAPLGTLHEWGLAGGRFGTVVSWFLIGGDLYTAYTFIAVPALLFGAGAMGFFAVPYTILIYPFAFLVLPRLWVEARRHGHVTSADFVRQRFDSPMLALAVALTGLLATLPYIALQLIGIQVVVAALGLPTRGFVGELPLLASFVILAAYTYKSGLRAPALIAIVKDLLIYITIVAAIIIIPAQLGGYDKIFAGLAPEKLLLKPATPGDFAGMTSYATLALGSALALFLYPHSLTAVLSADSASTVRRNMMLLPAYSLLLGLIALLGFMAIAARVDKLPQYAEYFAQYKGNFAVPALFLESFPDWFAGVALAALAIGALVPAAIMSIAAANLYTRNIHREFIRPGCSEAQETQVAKIVSLLVKVGAVVFVLVLPTQYAIQLQLLGGIWIIQTLPSLVLAMYLRLDSRALLAGWAVGMAWGTWAAAAQQFASSTYPLVLFGVKMPGYAALYALAMNLAVTIILSAFLPRRAPGAAKLRT